MSAGGVALVTGASSGSGRQIAFALAREGYDVAVLGRSADALAETARGVEAAGRRTVVLIADICDELLVARALDAFLSWSGDRIDVLVNAAGWTGPLSPTIPQTPLADFDRVMATNLRGPFLTLSRLLPVMYAQGQGRVVNIGGNHGLRGRAGRASFSASKWGLRGLSRSAALEAGAYGVTVNLIAPGPVAVERMDAAWEAQAQREGAPKADVVDRYMAAMGAALRRPSEMDDIVAAVLYLVGPGGGGVTGQELVIDGGVIV